MPFAERFGWTLLVSCVLGVLLILIGDGIPNAWGITLQELAQGEKREKAETGSFLAWLREFLGYVTSSFLLEGAWLAIKITVLAMAIGLFLGLALALMRLSGIWPLSATSWFYIWFMRGTPQLLQLVFIFDALPLIGLRFDTFTTAVIGFALNEAAFSGEIIRGGIISVDRNQLLQLVFIFDALPLIGLRFDTFTTAVIGFALNEAAFSGEIIRGGIISVQSIAPSRSAWARR